MLCRCCLWLFAYLARPLSQAVFAESSFHLPAPQNVTIVSYNFQSTLKWSPVMGINNSAVSYRVEYCTAPPCTDWREVNTPEYYKPECDFPNDVEKPFVAVTFRVRAEQGELKSDWVETPSFRASDQTILGPPREIDVTTEANSLIVSYEKPFDYNASYFVFDYIIIYWEKSTNKDLPPSDKKEERTERTEYKLENLKEMTEYCLHIQALIPNRESHLLGHLSDIYCKKTSHTDTNILWLTLPLILAIVLVLIFSCLLILQKYQNIIKSLWRPPLKIPLHYEEDLQNPQMTSTEEFQNCAGEDQWDSVSVISSVAQNPTVTKNTNDSNQEVQLLETEELG